MNLAEIKKNLEKLDKIRGIMEVSKFHTLQQLKNAIKLSDTLIEISLIAKSTISFATSKYWIKNAINRKVDESTVFVFITLPSSLLSISYDKHERMIKNEFDIDNDKLIVIGDPAIEFATKNKIEPIYAGKNPDECIDIVSSILTGLYLKEEVDRVCFISTSPKVKDEPAIILPLKEVNFSDNRFDTFIDKKYKFYPSIIDNLERLSSLYISRMTRAFLQEAKVYYLKEKLVRHEESLNSIDDLRAKNKKLVKKEERKKETSELILMNQIARQGGDDA